MVEGIEILRDVKLPVVEGVRHAPQKIDELNSKNVSLMEKNSRFLKMQHFSVIGSIITTSVSTSEETRTMTKVPLWNKLRFF